MDEIKKDLELPTHPPPPPPKHYAIELFGSCGTHIIKAPQFLLYD